jgi:hypothetical protein
MSIAPRVITPDKVDVIADRLDGKAGYAQMIGFVFTVFAIGLGISIIFVFYEFSVRNESADITSRSVSSDTLTNLLAASAGNGILRIGMVLLSIFMIQIVVGFARYYFRISALFSFAADIIRLGGGETKQIKELCAALLPTFDFGKMPTSPVEKIFTSSMDTIKEVAKKIPAK